MDLPKPSAVTDVQGLADALDAATHEVRLGWARSLGRSEQYALFELAKGRPVTVDELVGEPGQVVRHLGKNGLPLFSWFEKRFVRLPDGTVGGYNHNEFGLIAPIAAIVTGPGHFVAVDAPDGAPEVWIDYRRIPAVQHPDFPPLQSNEAGLPGLVFGDMVDVLRRVSRHITIGDSFKGKYPRDDQPPFLARMGATLFPTAPFVLCQEP
ncbi:MAG: hypothetical protein KC621_20355 [Myxococcales bacterium]|nr:hypothetical protein [Myxococcales bacterium]